MDKEVYGIYAMLLANLKMNYQILSSFVKHDNPILKEWKIYIDNMYEVLEELKQQNSN